MNRDFKGVWIPKEIWLDERLSPIDKGILGGILAFNNDEETYCIDNKELAKFCNCSQASVFKSIMKFNKLGYICVLKASCSKTILRNRG